MKYEITIRTSEIKEVYVGKDWDVISEGKDGKKYGNTPEIKKHKAVATVVYNQTVDELDMEAVIKAVNKIK